MNRPSVFASLAHTLTRSICCAIGLLAIAGLLWNVLPPAFTPSTLAQGPLPPPTPTPARRAPSGPPNQANYDLGNSATAGDPVSAADGAYMFGKTFLALGGPLPLNFGLFYHSNMPYYGSAGVQVPWRFNWSPWSSGTANCDLVSPPTFYTSLKLPNGTVVAFKREAGSTTWLLIGAGELGLADSGSRVQYVLKETAQYFYLMDPADGVVYIYNNTGDTCLYVDLRYMLDRNNNRLTFTVTFMVNGNKPTRIADGLGRQLDITYVALPAPGYTNHYLQTVTDQNGRQVTFTYDISGADNGGINTLRSITDPLSRTTTFRYAGNSNSLVTAETLPRGNLPVSNTYNAGSYNVISQRDAYSNTTYFTRTGTAMAVQSPNGNISQYQHTSNFSPPKAYTDTTNAAVNLTKNGNNQITGITDRFGDTTSMAYHAPSGKLASVTNAAGNTLSYTYATQVQTFTNPSSPTEQITFTFYNLTRVDYPATASALAQSSMAATTSEQFTTDAKGNVLTHTDQAGQVWTYTYNARGQLLTETSPTGGVTTNTYNADATLASTTDSDPGIGTTTFGYDAYKRLNRVTHPDATSIQITYDLGDEITSITDELSRTYTYAYDANGNLTAITDPAGQITNLAYDLVDRVTQITNRLNKTTSLAYDALGRLASTADPTGVAEAYGYDARSNDSRLWLNRVTRAGQNWQTNYDVEGLVSSITTPLSHTTTYQRDKLGNVTRVIDPLGQAIHYAYDALNRLTGVTDPLSRTTTYAYDALNRLIGVTDPVVGTATYQRDSAGHLTRITDLNGRNWNFGYSANGRLIAQTDPLSHTIAQSYDSRGRASVTTFPSTTLTRTYDVASNLIGLQSSTGLTIPFAYDSLNRLTTTSNLTLGYDAEGRITNTQDSLNFGATYDDAGRLKTATYDGSALVVTYTYSLTSGLLTRVNDSRSTQIDFTYDNDLRLIGLKRSNDVNATFSYDNADRLTRITDGSVLDLQYTLDAASQVTQLQMTAPLDPADYPIAPLALSFDAASQINTAGYAYDTRGRQTAAPGTTYAWDDASRLTAINTTTLTYNGLNDVRTRAEGGTTTHYYYNYALGLTPIVAEADESGIRDQGSGGREQHAPPLRVATGAIARTTEHATRYYIYTPGGALLYAIDATTNLPSFYHFDRSGSTLALTDNGGSVTDAYAYDPYGKLLGRTGTNSQPFTYVGKWGVRQESATLYQMRARYYDAAAQRFLSRDPIWPPVGDAQQTNPYNYAYNNPLKYTDVTGSAPDDIEAVKKEINLETRNLAELLSQRGNAEQQAENYNKEIKTYVSLSETWEELARMGYENFNGRDVFVEFRKASAKLKNISLLELVHGGYDKSISASRARLEKLKESLEFRLEVAASEQATAPSQSGSFIGQREAPNKLWGKNMQLIINLLAERLGQMTPDQVQRFAEQLAPEQRNIVLTLFIGHVFGELGKTEDWADAFRSASAYK